MILECPPLAVRQKLYGRESELRMLNDAFQKSQQPNQPTKYVFVRGRSGAGKSALISEVFKHDNKLCLYGLGKFEQRQDSKPCAALRDALASICMKMSQSRDAQHYKEVLLEQNVEPEALLTIANLVPGISNIIQIERTPEKNLANNENSKEGFEKLKFTLRLLLNAVSSPEAPVVLCLDDLQWIDSVSLSILESVLSDHTMRNVIFIGSYRDNEVDDDHILISWIQDIKESVQIPVKNLTIDGIEELLSDALNTGDIKCLAELMYTRTNGNVFYVLHYLDFLKAENLLRYTCSATGYRWSWDIARIRNQTTLTENVVDMVEMKLRRLHPDVQACLKYGSLLGFRLDEHILIEIHRAVVPKDKQEEQLDPEKCITKAIQEGVLERLHDGWLKFVHDRIHETAVQLAGDKEECAKIHLQIGTIVWQQHKCTPLADIDDRYLFICCDQLNLGRSLIHDQSFREDLARLNKEASTRAAALSAFSPAVIYLSIGLSLLDRYRRWENCYQLSLDLYTSMAEMRFCAGQMDECEESVKKVLAHAKSIDDSIQAYLVWTQCLAAQAKYHDQVSTSLEVLSQLGEQVSSKPGSFSSRRIFERTKRKLQTTSDEEILALPLMQNQHKIAAVQVLSEMMMTVDSLEMHHLRSNIICRMIDLAFEYGLAPYSAMGFALHAQLQVSKKTDIDSGVRFARLAVALLKRLNIGRLSSRVYLYSGMALHWRQPLALSVDYYVDAYQQGMRNGDINAAMTNITGYGIAYFYSGLPLASCVTDMEKFCLVMHDYGQKMFVLSNVPLYQCVLNLTGQSQNILDMSSGKACEYRVKLGWENRVGEQAEWSYLMQIAFYCEKFKLAKQLYRKLESVWGGVGRALPLFQTRVFFFTLICIHHAKLTGKRRYRVEAKKHLNVVRGWVVDKQAINVAHKLMILDAEMMTLGDKQNKNIDPDLVVAFDKAIAASSKAGFLQDAALAAHLMSRALTDNQRSHESFLRARHFYQTWGASGVVEHLDKASTLRSHPNSTSARILDHAGTRYQSRTRFDNNVLLEHQSLNFSTGAPQQYDDSMSSDTDFR